MRHLVSLLLLVLLYGGASCHKSTVIKGTVYKGRIVNSICGQITVQFMNGVDLGQDGWIDNGKTYNNIFRVDNPCDWNPTGRYITDTFSFILTTFTVQNCAQCLALGHTPDSAFAIQVIQ